jgi:hypothetical protein
VTLTVNTTVTRKAIKRVYRNEDGVPLTVKLTSAGVHLYAPGTDLSFDDFAHVVATMQSDWTEVHDQRQV